MNRRSQILRDLTPLITVRTDGALNEEQYEEAVELLRSSDEACEVYLDFFVMHTGLLQLNAPSTLTDAADGTAPDEPLDGFADWDVDEESVCQLLDELELSQAEGVGREDSTDMEVPASAGEQKRKPKKWSQVLPPNPSDPPSVFLSRIMIYGSLAAVIAIAVFLFNNPPIRDPDHSPNKDLLVGRLSEASKNAVLRDESRDFLVGDSLPPHELKLVNGQIQVTFQNGAEVMLAAPATFTPTSPSRLRLDVGTLAVHCPQRARGFQLETLTSVTTDLGTEFGVQVDHLGVTDVHVFVGRVQLQAGHDDTAANNMVQVRAGQARRVGEKGKNITEIPTAKKPFEDLLPHLALLDHNLIINGDFEADKPAEGPKQDRRKPRDRIRNIKITGWEDGKRDGLASVLPYWKDADQKVPRIELRHIPKDGGRGYFVAVEPGVTQQSIDLVALSRQIDASLVRLDFVGLVGGDYKDVDDQVSVVAKFLGGQGQQLKQSVFEPIRTGRRAKEEREENFVKRSDAGTVPRGTRSVRIEIVGRFQGGNSAIACVDAYADNLSLTLSIKSP